MFKYAGRFVQALKADLSHKEKCKECGTPAFAVLKLRKSAS
jgi:hypothetical protein